MTNLIKFLLKASDSEIFAYTMISAAIARHKTLYEQEGWLFYKIDSDIMNKYELKINSLLNSYA